MTFEENTEPPISDEVTSEVESEASLLFIRDDEPPGLGSLLNENRKGWTVAGSFSRIRFVTGLCSYTQSDPPPSLTHGVHGCFASHLYSSPS